MKRKWYPGKALLHAWAVSLKAISFKAGLKPLEIQKYHLPTEIQFKIFDPFLEAK